MEPLRSGDPRRISSYEILNRLGAGGMGQVYLGRSPSGRRVAVKVIRPELTNDPTFRQRFRREVTAMRQVSGFFTAPVVDADPDGDPAWLATAFVPGPSLESAITDGGAMPAQDVLLLAAGLAEALNAIHREGLTHRDLKPGNVLMADDGPRVIDFGLAVTADSASAHLTQAGTVVGTPAFMSPEQVSGQQVGPASDIWSLGAVLAYAGTGASPFGDGGTMETMLRVMNGEPDLSALTGTLAQLVNACMAKDPGARPTPARILQVLSEGAGVQPTMAMDVHPPEAGAHGDRAEGGSGADSGAQAQPPSQPPAWPTAEGAAQAVSGVAPAAPSQFAASPAQPAAPNSQPSVPTWGTNTPPSSPSPAVPSQAAAPVSQPSAPTWNLDAPGSQAPNQPSNPSAPAWNSGPAPAPTSQSSAPAWGSMPGQPSGPAPVPPSQSTVPAWGSGPVAGPPTAPSQAWPGAPGTPGAPGPTSGPSTPSQPVPSVTSNQWQQPTQPTYQSPPTQPSQATGPWIQPHSQPSMPYGVPMPPAKKNRKGLIAAAGIAAVVVIGGGIAIAASSGGSGGSSGGSTGGGSTGGTLGGSGGIGALTPIAADFQLTSMVTDSDAAQYLKTTPSSNPPTTDTQDDPTTLDQDWQGSANSSELRVQASNYKAQSGQAKTDFLNHTSTLATDSPYEDEGALGNSDKTEIQISTDQSSGLQHCKVEVLRGGLDVTITYTEPGSAAAAHTDVLNLAKAVTGRLPAK